jgi:hypothetical protein
MFIDKRKDEDQGDDALKRVTADFDQHVCDEDFSQAAVRVVREATETNRLISPQNPRLEKAELPV